MNELRQKWNNNSEVYKIAELGSGVHDFINDILGHPDLFALKKTPKKTATTPTYIHDTEKSKHGRPDFILYANKDVTIPCEAKCYTRIEEGVKQLRGYRSDYTKEYGILTDGFTWRFYRSNSYEIWTLDQMLENPKLFRTFWETYLTPENYYTEILQPSGQRILFEESMDLNDSENRKIFFKETSQLIARFRTKIKIDDNKTALETSYAYLIQFILYKSLVDNRFVRFESEYKRFRQQIVAAIRNKDLYNLVVFQIRNISEYISKNIYQPFAQEQRAVNEILIADLQRELSIQDIAPWLDIVAFINKFDFSNLQNEIFGFVYENYLKDLYGNNWGQNFTDPAVVDFMLDELGYTPKELAKDKTKISIIDPACGAGTFLYSAVDRIVEAFEGKGTKAEAVAIKELVDKNVFGLDIAEFPLYLAEMCILLRQLPLIVNELYNDPVEKKLKLFKTRDSISEFLDTGISAQERPVDLLSQVQAMALDYKSFMRDDENLLEMLRSMQSNGEERLRFDFVAMNPPYVGYLECLRQKTEFTQKIKDKSNTSITLGNVFGVNLHSVPEHPKRYRPNPNLYAFFFALGIALLKENGKLCFIVPQTLLTAGDLDVLRYHLAKNVTIEKIFTFSANLFIGRGLQQNKAVPTSSMIIVAKKKKPDKNHAVKVIRFQFKTDKKGSDFTKLLKSKKRETKSIPQTTFAEHWDNWNFINHDAAFLRFYETYLQHSESIDIYHNHKLAKQHFNSEFWFDGGYAIDEKQTQETPADYAYPRINHRFYTIRDFRGYWKNIRSGNSPQRIDLTQGNQEYNLLDTQYKILWSYANTKRFYFTDKPVIWARNQYNAIGSNNRKELIYLFALLNSPLNYDILRKQLKNEKEKDFLISRSSLKDYVRIPIITKDNQKLKDKIITLTESMLAFESVILRDIVDFGRLNVQQFDTIGIEKNELLLSNNKEFRLKIADGKAKLVQKVIKEKFQDKGFLTGQTVSLTELKSLPGIDFDRQHDIKKEIDDIIFALYFNTPVKDVEKHEFYGYMRGYGQED